MENLRYIMIGLDIFALITLAIYLLVGLYSGTKRGIVKLLVNLLPLIIFSICLNPIVNKVEKTKFSSSNLSGMVSEELLQQCPEQVSLEESLNIIIVQQVFEGDVSYLTDSKTTKLVGELGQTVIRAGIFIIGTFLLMIIVVPLLKWIIIRITNLIGFTKKRKGKIGGLLLGACNYVIFFVALFVPLYNMVNLASDVTKELIENKEQLNITEETSTNLGYVAELTNQSFVNKSVVKPFNVLFTKNIYPKYVSMFGNPFKIKDGKTSINLIDEYNNIKKLLPVILSLKEGGVINADVIDLTKISDTDLDTIKEVLSNTKLLNTLMPAAIEILGFKQKDNPTFTNLDFKALSNADWKQELDNIFGTIDVLKKNKFIINKASFDYSQDSFINFVTDTIKIVASSPVITTEIAPWAADMYITKLEEGGSLGVDFDNQKFLDANWSIELTAVANAFHEFSMGYKKLAITKDNWKEALYKEDFEPTVQSFVNSCLDSSLLKQEFIPKFLQMFLEKTLQDPKFSFIKDILSDVNDAITLLETQVHVLVDIVKDLDKLKVFEGNTTITPEMSDDLTKLLTDVFDLTIIKGHEALIIDSIIDIAGFKEILTNYNITLHYENVTDYKEEIINIKDFVMKAMQIKDMDFNNLLLPGSLERSNVGELVDSMYNCKLVGDNVFSLVEKIFTDNGYPITFTEDDKLYFNTHTFKDELLHIFNLYDIYQAEALKGDYTKFDADVIYDLTIKASTKLLSTKVVCLLLNDTFSAKLGITFTQASDLTTYATLLKDAINASNLLSGGINLEDKAQTDLLVDTIKSLGANPEVSAAASNAIDAALNKDLNCTAEEMTSCADVMASVLATYQASSNKETFDQSDLSAEQINDINNNKLAKELASVLLGITL